jgi:5'-nucleotidase
MPGRLRFWARMHARAQAQTGPGRNRHCGLQRFHGALVNPHQAVLVPNGSGKTGPEGQFQLPWARRGMASAVDSVRGKYPNHVTVSAGDLIWQPDHLLAVPR